MFLPSGVHSRRAVAALALVVFAGAHPARAADPDAPQNSEEVEQESEESPSGEPTAEPAAPGAELKEVLSEGIEEIIITGEKASGILEGAPISDVQFDPEQLRAMGVEDVSDLARFTPSLEINTLSATVPTFFIRGVGLNDFNANAPGAVAIYRDGVPINAPAIQLGQLFDVENVEILRGPQGWGDDRNASGGVIETYSRKPDGNFDAYLNGQYGNYNFKDFEGALGAPLMDGVLSSRFAFRLTQRDPFYDNGCGGLSETPEERLPPPPSPPARGSRIGPTFCGETRTTVDNPRYDAVGPPLPAFDSDGDPRRVEVSLVPNGLPTEVNDVSSWAARGQLRFQPPDTEQDWLLNAHGGRIDHFSQLGQVIGTGTGAGATSSGYTDPAVERLFQENLQALPPITLPNPGCPGTGNVAVCRTKLARDQTLAQVVKDISLADPFENQYDLVGKEKQDSAGGFLRGDFSVGPVLGTTITGTEWYDRSRLTDFDFSPNPAIHIYQADHAQQWTQNLGFEWEDPERPLWLRWGGYYLHENLASEGFFRLSPVGGFANLVDQVWDQGLDSFGIFGNFSFDFLEDFTLEGGARFNWEHKDFGLKVGSVVVAAGSTDPPPSSFAPETTDARTWSAPTGGLSLTYRFTDEVSAYLKYTRGWKGGHFNASVIQLQLAGEQVVTATPSVAEPETINAYETGLNGAWFDGRLALGASLFYYDYQNYQVFITQNQVGSPPQLQVINANDARIWGAEADFQVRPLADWAPAPLEGLVLSGRFGWLESEFLDFSDTRTVLIPAQPPFITSVVVDYSGNRVPNTPRFKVSLTAEYTLDLGRFGTLIPRYDYTWTDDVFFDPSEGVGANEFFDRGTLPEYSLGQSSYGLHDVRLTYRLPNESVEISGWVQNLTNEVYKTYTADLTLAADSILNFIGDPRTYGIAVSVSF